MAPRIASRYGLASHLLLGAAALSSTSNHLINAPRVDAASGAPLVPSPKRFGAGVAWALPQETRRPFDAGSPRELAWWDDAPARTIFARGDIEVAEVPAPASPLGGSWRLLRTAGGRVVQSAGRVVDGQVHCGCLVGYTRGLGAAAFAGGAGASAALALGLGGGAVASFLAAHGPHAVTAVEVDAAVIDAARATTAPPASVRIVEACAAAFCAAAAADAYDVVVVDVFDEASRLPGALASPAFAADVVRIARGAIALNVVRVTALDARDPGGDDLAAAVVAAVDARGGSAFLAPDAATENGVLFCVLDGDVDAAVAVARAGRRGKAAGLPFDAAAQLAAARKVTPATVRGALRALDEGG